jgi:hypothetical protein
MERRKIIGAAVFSAAIAGGGIAGVVLGSPATSSAATAGSTTTTAPSARPGRGIDGHGPELDAAAKAIGISTDTLMTDLQGGKTIAQVAASKGVAVSAVISAMVAAAKSDFNSNVTQHITDEVNGTFERPHGPAGPGGPERGFGFRGGFGLDAAAKAIGVSTDTLEQDLKNGQTIAAVAKSKGVAVKTVVDAMVASAKSEFDSQVKAGHLSADQAAKIEANLTSMITNVVNGTLPHPNGGPGGHGGFGGPGGGYGTSGGGGSGQPSSTPAGLNA